MSDFSVIKAAVIDQSKNIYVTSEGIVFNKNGSNMIALGELINDHPLEYKPLNSTLMETAKNLGFKMITDQLETTENLYYDMHLLDQKRNLYLVTDINIVVRTNNFTDTPVALGILKKLKPIKITPLTKRLIEQIIDIGWFVDPNRCHYNIIKK